MEGDEHEQSGHLCCVLLEPFEGSCELAVRVCRRLLLCVGECVDRCDRVEANADQDEKAERLDASEDEEKRRGEEKKREGAQDWTADDSYQSAVRSRFECELCCRMRRLSLVAAALPCCMRIARYRCT